VRFGTKLRLRLRSLFRRDQVEREMENELRFHLDQQIEENLAAGMTPQEARAAALRLVGGITQFQEECRDMRRVNWIENAGQDLRYGFRSLCKTPGFTVIAILTLALGIGANTAIFSVVHAALIRPLPYAEPDRLITLGEVRRQQALADRGRNQSWVASNPDFLDWRAQAKTFESLAGFGSDGFTLRGMGEAESVAASQVTTNFFATLGVKPALGRDFQAGEDLPTGPHVAILTDGFWRSRFGADPKVVGRTIRLDSNAVTVVGVMPREFEFAPARGAKLWVPLHIQGGSASRRSLRWMSVFGRLAPGATPSQAISEFRLISAHLAAQYPDENGSTQVLLTPLRERIIGAVQPLLLVLFGAVAFVLLIACANVANLLMARATGRRREFAVRAALGAGRGRLISQLLTESLMLAFGGAVLGLVLARFGVRLLIAAIPAALLDSAPFLRNAHADPTVLAFLFGITVITGIAFGLAPAVEVSNRNLGETLKEESRSSAGGMHTRFRHTLVVVEIAFSLVLLVGAGLMVRSLSALLDRNPGFDTRRLLTFSTFLPPNAYKDSAIPRFDQEFRNRMQALPGVTGVAYTSVFPMTGGGNSIRFVIQGHPMPPGQENECSIRNISAGFFSMMGIPLVAGRFFNDTDDTNSAPKRVIVNQAWVKRNLAGENQLGKQVRFTFSATQPFREIVGVVADIAESNLDGSKDPILFVPYSQGPSSFLSYVVRTAGEPAPMTVAARDTLRAIDPQLVLIQPRTMDEIIGQSTSVFLRRYPSLLIGSFAVLALILGMVGLYGLMSYTVSQRRREVGVRIALGAQSRDVMRLVVAEGARLTLVGVGLGLLAAAGLTQLMSSLLFGVGALDPETLIGGTLLLMLVATVACYVPARRATRTDPIRALRCE